MKRKHEIVWNYINFNGFLVLSVLHNTIDKCIGIEILHAFVILYSREWKYGPTTMLLGCQRAVMSFSSPSLSYDALKHLKSLIALVYHMVHKILLTLYTETLFSRKGFNDIWTVQMIVWFHMILFRVVLLIFTYKEKKRKKNL